MFCTDGPGVPTGLKFNLICTKLMVWQTHVVDTWNFLSRTPSQCQNVHVHGDTFFFVAKMAQKFLVWSVKLFLKEILLYHFLSNTRIYVRKKHWVPQKQEPCVIVWQNQKVWLGDCVNAALEGKWSQSNIPPNCYESFIVSQKRSWKWSKSSKLKHCCQKISRHYFY